MTEKKFVYVDADYLKELEEKTKKVDYYKGIIDGMNLVIDRKDEPQLTAKCLNCANSGSYKCSKCDGEMYFKDEPQTETSTNSEKVQLTDEPPKMGSIKRPKTGICAKCGRDDCEQKMEHIDNCNGYIEPRTEEPSFTATDFGKGTITRYIDEPQTEVIVCPIMEDDADYYERLYADDIKRMKEERSE